MPKLHCHATEGTYYTVMYKGGLVTRQIHPDGVLWLKQSGVRLGGEISADKMRTLEYRRWLYTKEEIPHWGAIDWAPDWHTLGTDSTINPYVAWVEAQREAKRQKRTNAPSPSQQPLEKHQRPTPAEETRQRHRDDQAMQTGEPHRIPEEPSIQAPKPASSKQAIRKSPSASTRPTSSPDLHLGEIPKPIAPPAIALASPTASLVKSQEPESRSALARTALDASTSGPISPLTSAQEHGGPRPQGNPSQTSPGPVPGPEPQPLVHAMRRWSMLLLIACCLVIILLFVVVLR